MADRAGFGQLHMVHGRDLKIKGVEVTEKGLCEIHYDKIVPKDTNPSYQREISGFNWQRTNNSDHQKILQLFNIHVVN